MPVQDLTAHPTGERPGGSRSAELGEVEGRDLEHKSVRELIADLARLEDRLRLTTPLPAVVDHRPAALRLDAEHIVSELRRRRGDLPGSGSAQA